MNCHLASPPPGNFPERQCSRRGLTEGQQEPGKERAASFKQARQVLLGTAGQGDRLSRPGHHLNTRSPTEAQGTSEGPDSLLHALLLHLRDSGLKLSRQRLLGLL